MKAATDRAGNLTAMLLFAINLGGMVAALILKKTELGIPSTIAVLVGGAFYLFQMFRNGAISGQQAVFPKGRRRAVLVFSLGGIAATVVRQLFTLWENPDLNMQDLLGNMLEAIFFAAFWTSGMIIGFWVLARLGEKRLKRLEK